MQAKPSPINPKRLSPQLRASICAALQKAHRSFWDSPTAIDEIDRLIEECQKELAQGDRSV